MRDTENKREIETAKVEIETLSPVHIGNGRFLYSGNDFIEEKNGFLYVLDINKLGSAIGTDTQSINKWINAIQTGHHSDFITKIIGTGTKGYDKFCKRQIKTTFKGTNDTLKECIHDGKGYPYIPGSSIKGAIRTAVMAPFAQKKLETSDWKKKFRNMESEIFGKGKNDIFRHLYTGDAYFTTPCTCACKQINLNIREDKNLIDNRKQQIVEAINRGNDTVFRLNINREFYRSLNGIHNIPDLFRHINDHTRELVEYEISFWEEQPQTGAEVYIDNMKEISEDIKKCKDGECVLRIGQASGWRFITGAWAEVIKEKDKKIFDEEITRRKHYYNKYVFPKSRRIYIDKESESVLFGFVKLKIIS